MLIWKGDKLLNCIAKVVLTGETRSSECLTGEQAEPRLDLIEPVDGQFLGSSLFGVGRTARPVTASTVGARPIVQVGDRGNDAPWKARKTNFRFSLPSHRPWKSRLGPISTFPPSRRRFGDDALNSEQARPAVHASFIDPKAPPTQRFFATHTKQRGGEKPGYGRG